MAARAVLQTDPVTKFTGWVTVIEPDEPDARLSFRFDLVTSGAGYHFSVLEKEDVEAISKMLRERVKK